jgi:hypothetical protein
MEVQDMAEDMEVAGLTEQEVQVVVVVADQVKAVLEDQEHKDLAVVLDGHKIRPVVEVVAWDLRAQHRTVEMVYNIQSQERLFIMLVVEVAMVVVDLVDLAVVETQRCQEQTD